MPLTLWLSGCFALVALAAFGPRLWARQPFDNAAYGLQIVTIGESLMFVTGLPYWAATSQPSKLVIILSAPAFVLLTGWSEPTSLEFAAETAIRVGILTAIVSTIWAIATRFPAAGRWVWIGLLFWSVGLPALTVLNADYSAGRGLPFHFGLLRALSTTFFH